MKRRDFLKYSGTAAAVAAGTRMIGGMPVYASSPVSMLGDDFLERDSVLIVIQLFGGNDGLNTVIPAEDPFYHNMRPGISVPSSVAIRIGSSDAFFHPAMVEGVSYDGMRGLHDNGRLAVIQGIGYENPNLSHFRSTDIWLSGFNPTDETISNDPNLQLQEGWVGKFFANQLPDFPQSTPDYPLSLQVGGVLSKMLRSRKGDMGIAITDPEEFLELGSGLTPDEAAMAGVNAYEREFNFVRQIALDSQEYADVVEAAFDNGSNTVEYPDGFAQQMRLVARLMSGGLKTKVFMLSMGGFDNHVNQQGDDFQGLHPNLLRQLTEAISLFQVDALQQGFAEKVIGLTVSEFGRRPQENGSRGTDHGAASVQFVWGNNVRGGVYGENPDLENLNSNNDVQYQHDYRRIYAEVLETWFGATTDEVVDVLGKEFVHLGILNPPPSTSVLEPRRNNPFFVSPNPSRGSFSVDFELKRAAYCEAKLFDMRGAHVATIDKKMRQAGFHSVHGLYRRSGSYLVMVKVQGRQFTMPLNIIR